MAHWKHIACSGVTCAKVPPFVCPHCDWRAPFETGWLQLNSQSVRGVPCDRPPFGKPKRQKKRKRPVVASGPPALAGSEVLWTDASHYRLHPGPTKGVAGIAVVDLSGTVVLSATLSDVSSSAAEAEAVRLALRYIKQARLERVEIRTDAEGVVRRYTPPAGVRIVHHPRSDNLADKPSRALAKAAVRKAQNFGFTLRDAHRI